MQIGVTCHDSRHLAMEAGEKGADYVAFGAFYPTTTKPSDYRPDPRLLSWWASLFEVPCVAIGGITPANAAPLIAAGRRLHRRVQRGVGQRRPGERSRQVRGAVRREVGRYGSGNNARPAGVAGGHPFQEIACDPFA